MQVDLKSDNAANWEIPQFRKKKKCENVIAFFTGPKGFSPHIKRVAVIALIKHSSALGECVHEYCQCARY